MSTYIPITQTYQATVLGRCQSF